MSVDLRDSCTSCVARSPYWRESAEAIRIAHRFGNNKLPSCASTAATHGVQLLALILPSQDFPLISFTCQNSVRLTQHIYHCRINSWERRSIIRHCGLLFAVHRVNINQCQRQSMSVDPNRTECKECSRLFECTHHHSDHSQSVPASVIATKILFVPIACF